MEEIKCGVKELLFKEGDKANKLYIVKSGEVLCLKFSSDRLFPVFLAKEGDIIGESALMQDQQYGYSALSLSSSHLVAVSSFSFKQIFNNAPDWMKSLMSTMLARMDFTSSLISENRILHPSIIGEDRYTQELEVELKKMILSS